MTDTATSAALFRSPTPCVAIASCYAAIRAFDDPALFISLKPETEAMAEAEALEREGARGRALWGVPVAVKDNIDVAGLPTTAACPAYAYMPAQDATAVARLKAAGAIIIGKTNLDQFATGLVGVRSPYGVPRNALKADLVPGGSSSGSATAVAAGIVPIALGTDTAGSGRVPAMLQNLVGLKPSLGLVSTAGVVPACRTLDCVSIFALTVDDAWSALQVIAGPDEQDPFSRSLPLGTICGMPPHLHIGIPREQDLDFAGDSRARAAFAAGVERLHSMNANIVTVDFSPFLEAALLLYQGPWVAERWLVVEDLLERDAQAIHPVTRAIIETAEGRTAAETFAARYRLTELTQAARQAMAQVDMIMVPTAPRPVTLEEIAADPIGANSMLGRYTNCANLLDLAALAAPSHLETDNTAYGVTFLAPSGGDAALANLGRIYHAASRLPLGATGRQAPPLGPSPARAKNGQIEIAVVGAHMSGMPLNHELTGRSATFLRATTTTPDYNLFALSGGPPARPGLIRVKDSTGAQIALEVWSMDPASFGTFVAAIPAPLGIGTIRLADGTTVKGFMVEPQGLNGAEDVTSSGSWRAYCAAKAKSPADA